MGGCPLILLWYRKEPARHRMISNTPPPPPVKLNLCWAGPRGPAAAADSRCIYIVRGGVHTQLQHIQVNKSIYLLLFYCMCYVSFVSQQPSKAMASWIADFSLSIATDSTRQLTYIQNFYDMLLARPTIEWIQERRPASARSPFFFVGVLTFFYFIHPIFAFPFFLFQTEKKKKKETFHLGT